MRLETYRIENLNFTYPGREKPALSGVSLIISQGEFITLCGPSGCGKTTLLRQLKPSLAPHGRKSGTILFGGTLLEDLPEHEAAAKIGFVLQSPENQIVTDKVWHELAFGLESLGVKTPEIRLRVAEMASFFGIQTWFHKPVTELSGGQKQLLALASIMVLQPSALILDEPTSQLDPIAAGEFLATVGKINRELGVTVILTEHRLEEAFPLSSRALVMDGGKVIADGAPREAGLALRGQRHGMFLAMPAPMRIWAACESGELGGDAVGAGSGRPGAAPGEGYEYACPVTVRDGAEWLAGQTARLQPEAGGAEWLPGQAARLQSEAGGAEWLAGQKIRLQPEAGGAEWLPGQTARLQPEAGDAEWIAGQTARLQPEADGVRAQASAQGTAAETPSAVAATAAAPAPPTADPGPAASAPKTPPVPDARRAIDLDEIWFKYEKNMPDVVKGLSFRANYGEITAILGGNGTGKTTTLSLVAGLYEPYRGKITVGAQIYTLPQNPQTLFVAKTVREDLLEVFSGRKMAKAEKLRQLAAIVKLCRLDGLLDSHPYDLSGGEQQRAALAKVLLLQPKILLLDEPTKGLDAEFKQVFAAILRRLTDAGVAVVMASHDVEFCAEHADRCALFFDGDIVSENTPRAFFSGNSFYTTSANRMARGILPGAVTADDIILALGGTLPPAPALLDMDAKYDLTPVMQALGPKPPGLSLPRRILVGLFGALLLAAVAVAAQNFDGLLTFISGGNEAVSIADEGAPLYAGIMLAFAAGVAGLAFTLAEKREDPPAPLRIAAADRKLSKRTLAAAVMILLAIPLTVYAGSYFFGDRKYYFISLLIILETMLPFALVFESRKPQARELVVIAVLCAIAVAGRAAFFMLPQFKPVVALVIIAGVAFGGEAGFLVGAMTGFVSNFFFGQGPWTPYQMFAFGAIGFLSGVLFRKGLLRRTPASLAVYGAFITFLVYGGIMNPASVMIYQNAPTGRMLLIAYLQGIPFDLVHAAATMTFLAVIARPMLEKLDRIKLKYGLISG